MVGAVVDMAHALGAIAVAEAVETAEQMRALRNARCDALQGWLLGRPGALRP
jgi:EAL domain-containing protein (putative c-di-GMP-specific phosphodiesterase class I)